MTGQFRPRTCEGVVNMLSRLSTTAMIVVLASCYLFVGVWVVSGILFALTTHTR